MVQSVRWRREKLLLGVRSGPRKDLVDLRFRRQPVGGGIASGEAAAFGSQVGRLGDHLLPFFGRHRALGIYLRLGGCGLPGNGLARRWGGGCFSGRRGDRFFALRMH